MNLQEFFDYKSQLIKDIITNETIVKLINNNVPFEDAKSLVYSQIFPYEYVPETAETSKTYVCCDVDVQENIGKTFIIPILYVWVFTHQSKLRMAEGGVLTDTLCHEICKVVNGSRFYSMGEINLRACKRFAPLTDMNGKVMIFEGKEFSKQFNGNKPTPKNRREGI